MKGQVLKVSGPFPTVVKEGEPPVYVWTIRFVYGDKTAEGAWQSEGLVNITGDLTKKKVLDAIKALLAAEAPHAMDGTEFTV